MEIDEATTGPRYLRVGKSYCIHHGEVYTFIEPDGTLVHYDDLEGKECHGMFVETPPPDSLTEEEWEAVFANEGQSHEYP